VADEGTGFEQSPFDSQEFSTGDLFLPPGLVVNPDTGWLYGYIPKQAQVQQEFTFAIKVVKADDPLYSSPLYYCKITTITDFLRRIQWLSPQNLGTIKNGAISELRVEATNPLGSELTYRLRPGATGRLPQGLTLLSDGSIVGRASFKTFSLDGNTTRFDGRTTTIDNTYRFTVNARDASGSIDIDRDFVIHVDAVNTMPYENLYIVSRLLASDRARLQSLFDDQDVFPDPDIYRANDPYFGVARDLRFLLGYGLSPELIETYVQAMQTSHYNKNLRFGDIKHARALNRDGTVRYEVVYIDVVDTQENRQGQSLPNTIVTATGLTLHPNSLTNMQTTMAQSVGQVNPNVLPDWMTSRQTDGTITNYLAACVLAYVVPGAGEATVTRLKRLINNRTFDFKSIKFDVDRYVWDVNLTKYYDKYNQKFDFSSETTFDAESGDQTVFDSGGLRFFSSETVFDTRTTYFDNRTTRFSSSNDVFQAPDQDDKYLKFPKIGAK
jgi:hypothetical protein